MEPRCRGRRTKITSSRIVDCINQDVLESTLTPDGVRLQKESKRMRVCADSKAIQRDHSGP